MHTIEELKSRFDAALELTEFRKKPGELYEPIQYALQGGGKRVRPVCLLASCEMFGGQAFDAINQALAVEIFHNFTLLHDDIMDEAPLRRGRETVHIKYNSSVGILAGDAMMILAYQYLKKNAEDKAFELFSYFNKTAIEVCEGQQLDMNFEDPQSEVSLDQYLDMIAKKTAVLLGEALRLGAMMADATDTDCQLVYEFGKNFGIAFQLQDDLLDLYGDPKKFGKQNGGDILAGKKTFLYLKALEVAQPTDADKLKELYYDQTLPAEEKIDRVRKLFDKLKIKDLTTAEMNRYYLKSGMALHSISAEDDRKKVLKEYAESLMVREI